MESRESFSGQKTWRLPELVKENGHRKRQWLPKGIAIPTFEGDDPIKIKIRRSDWNPDDSFPGYVEVSGSKQCLSVFGEPGKPVIIVESELDAMLIQKEASHLVWCVALGRVGKRADKELDSWLKQAPLILLSLDHDEVGKSLGDAASLLQIDVLRWLKDGLAIC